jgi:phage-related protein
MAWGAGVFEIALPFKGDVFRVVYVVQLADEIWVVRRASRHPQREIDNPGSAG